MPPWPPTRGYTPFQYDRSLTEEERYVMLTWLRSSMPEGNPADYEAPDEDNPPEQDFNLSLRMPQAYTPTLRPDDHRCFAIEWPLARASSTGTCGMRPWRETSHSAKTGWFAARSSSTCQTTSSRR